MTHSFTEHTGSGPAEWLPREARVIVLVGAAGTEWAPAVAVELANLVGRYRDRTLLANTVAGPRGPDALLEAEGRPGLTAALAGTSGMADVAITPAGCAFTYIPAGWPALSFPRLSETGGFRHLLHQVPRGKGTLLLYLAESHPAEAETSLYSAHEPPSVDGCVLLGPVDETATRAMGWRLLARVERPGTGGTGEQPGTGLRLASPEPADGSANVTREADKASQLRTRAGPLPAATRLWQRRGKPGLQRIQAIAIVWGLAVAAVWIVWQTLSGWPVFEDPVPDSPGMIDAPTATPAADSASESSEEQARAGEAAEPSTSAAAPPPTFAGTDLPYSVLIASYVNWEDADEQRRALDREGELFLVSPTLIRGRLYYRVLSGAVRDRIQAARLMDDLVAAGLKEQKREWDMRPVALAFDLGTFASAGEADSIRDLLHERGLPGYVLSDGGSPNPAYRVYAGAFESAEAAAALDSLLRDSGYAAQLVSRRGETP